MRRSEIPGSWNPVSNTNALIGLTIVSTYEPLPYRFTASAGKFPRPEGGLPGNVGVIIGSAFASAPAYRQEGGASSRLARDPFQVRR